MSKTKQIVRSMTGLPGWVQAWIAILFGANMMSFAFASTEVGWWIAVAFAAVASLNIPAMLIQGGLTRLLSLPHFIWLPLVIYLYGQLYGAAPLADGSLRDFATAIFVLNSVSLLFDVLEAYRWLRGRREVLGLS